MLGFVNGSVLVRIYGGPGIEIIKGNVELDSDPKLFQNRFLGVGIETIYGPGPGS